MIDKKYTRSQGSHHAESLQSVLLFPFLGGNKSIVKFGYNEHSVVMNRFLSRIGHFSTQINPVITNNELFVMTEFDFTFKSVSL